MDHISIRAYEFLNYYRFTHPRPAAEQIDLQAQLRLGEDGDYRLHLAVVSEAVSARQRPPLNLVISVDTSGSMGRVDMSLARSTIVAVAGRLGPGDIVSVVSWDDDQQILLDRHAVTMPYDLQLMMAAARLDSGGATDLGAGLLEAYRVAEAGRIYGGLNRVLLISDGSTNMGRTQVELIREMAGDRGEHGIFLLGVGVGDAGDYHDGMIDSITDAGQGPGIFLATTDDVRGVVYDRFDTLVDVAALDLSLELTLPVGFERIDTEPDPRAGTEDAVADSQNLAPGRTLVLQERLRSTCPETTGSDAEIAATVRWVDPCSGQQRECAARWTLGELLAGDTTELRKSEAVVVYAEALKLTKQGVDPGRADLALLQARLTLDQAIAAEPLDPELQDIDQVLQRLEQDR